MIARNDGAPAMTIETSDRSSEDIGPEQAAGMLRISLGALMKKLD